MKRISLHHQYNQVSNKNLLIKGVFQLSLFDEDLCEVEDREEGITLAGNTCCHEKETE